MRQKLFKGIPLIIGLALLILDSKTAIAGGANGIALCLHSLVPTIFPFLILTYLLCPIICSTNSRLLRPLGRLLGVPAGSEGIFVMGLLGGYPMGAQMITSAWRSGGLTRAQAHRMLSFCSNAGPSFLFGILSVKFSSSWMLWLLWAVHILSAILVAILIPGDGNSEMMPLQNREVSFVQALRSSTAVMAQICGWVILFRIILTLLDRWVLWLLPNPARVAVYGIFELANGCCSLEQITSEGLRFILCSGMLAFGGCCVGMQTASVCSGLGLGHYFPGKILQTGLSLIISSILQFFLFSDGQKVLVSPLLLIFVLIVVLVFAFSRRKVKIGGRNPEKIGV